MFLHDWHKGRPFQNAGGFGFPYLEIDSVQFYERTVMQDMRNAYHLLKPAEWNRHLHRSLNESPFTGDKNPSFQKDIQWRSEHHGAQINYWNLVQSDIPSQLSEGFALRDDGPLVPGLGIKPTLDPSAIERAHFKGAQLMRSIFRAFHRRDGERSYLCAFM